MLEKNVFAPVYLCGVMLLGVLKVIFGTCRSEPAPGLTLAVQMNFTVTDQTQMTAVYSKSHHWNPMQTPPERFKYVVSHVSGESQMGHCCCCDFFLFFLFFLHLFVGNRGWRRSSFASFRRCRVTEAENHHANPVIWPRVRGSGSRLSTNPPLMDICFTSCATGQILPLLHCTAWLIFCVSELWIVVLPHRNKQMAARSWVITKPLPEWLVLGRAASIRGRRLAPVFAQALKSSSGFVTLCVCSG